MGANSLLMPLLPGWWVHIPSDSPNSSSAVAESCHPLKTCSGLARMSFVEGQWDHSMEKMEILTYATQSQMQEPISLLIVITWLNLMRSHSPKFRTQARANMYFLDYKCRNK